MQQHGGDAAVLPHSFKLFGTDAGPCSASQDPAQHLSLQITWASPPWDAGVVCARQLGWTQLFTWLQWFLVVRAGWPEEKWFGCSTGHGAGFARAEGKTRLLCSLGFLSVAAAPHLWLLVAPNISGQQMPWQHGASRTELSVSFLCQGASLGGASCHWPCPCTVRGLCLAHVCRQNRVFLRDSLPPTGGEAGSVEPG